MERLLTIVLLVVVLVLTVATGSEDCGVAPYEHDYRIVGGQDTGRCEFPWQVSLMYHSGWWYHTCGGSVINDRWVLTAAHCVHKRTQQMSKWKVVLGQYNRERWDGHELEVGVDKIFKHPAYDDSEMDNDVALIKLSTAVVFNDYMSPVCLPTGNDSVTYEGELAIVTGWGATIEGGSGSDRLQKVTVPVIGQQQCVAAYSDLGWLVSDGMICALDNGKDSCQGDSGGPMVVRAGSKYNQVGVVSWGYGCARDGYPGVYARMTHYTEWVTQIVAAN